MNSHSCFFQNVGLFHDNIHELKNVFLVQAFIPLKLKEFSNLILQNGWLKSVQYMLDSNIRGFGSLVPHIQHSLTLDDSLGRVSRFFFVQIAISF